MAKAHIRDGIFYLRKRVPRRFEDVEKRREIWLSLHTDSKIEAERRLPMVWAERMRAWEALQDGRRDAATLSVHAARKIARAHGVRYVPIEELSALGPAEVVGRVTAISEHDGVLSRNEAKAFLGIADKRRLTISQALDEFWTLTKDQVADRSDDQIRKWRNPRIKAMNAFVEGVGDLYLDEISAGDTLDFRNFLWDRIEAGEIKADTANKDLAHFGTILRTVNRMLKLELSLPLEGLRFKVELQQSRPPFSDDWITSKILASGALSGLNTEARCIVLGMVNTGYRPSEGASLLEADIRLDHNVPHIHIHGKSRPLKTPHSERIIPLCGVSLEAFRACPKGFPRYFDSPSLSAAVNKYLRAHDLQESPDHTLYSFRHSFEDRLLDADVDERIRRDLMGHTLNRVRYGKGASLEKLHSVISQIAF